MSEYPKGAAAACDGATQRVASDGEKIGSASAPVASLAGPAESHSRNTIACARFRAAALH